VRRILALILILSTALGVIYSVVVPPFEASDEKWHYPMVKYIADNWALPVQEPGVETPWRQEGSQPPLYYALAAAATFWIDTSDMETVRHLNPYVDAGATPDGNVNLVVHHPARELFPWRGTVLAVHIVRLLSVLMGTVAVYLTYLIVRQVLPDNPALALGAAAIHAFTPMVVFISGSVNNDNLVVPLCSLALLMLLRMINPKPVLSKAEGSPTCPEQSRRACPEQSRRIPNPKSLTARYLLLGFVLGLAALTKTTSLALTVLTAFVVVVRAVRRRSWGEFFLGGLATLLPLLLIAGWWYLRNLRLYGDLFGLNAFIEILGQRDVPADLAQLWRERYSFAAGYWGNFGGLNVPMAAWVYSLLNALTVIAALGLFILLLRNAFMAKKHWLFGILRGQGIRVPNLLGVRRNEPEQVRDSDTSSTQTPIDPKHLLIVHCSLFIDPLFISLLWGLGVVVPWMLWAFTTWSSQGRLVFSAIPVWSLLLALGLVGWLPRRWGQWAVAAFALFLFGLTVVAPCAWIAPAYALPEPLTGAQVAAIPYRLEADFGGVMRLLGYDLQTELPSALGGVGGVEPGGQVEVTLYWEALAPTDRDYAVFVHLLGEEELLVAQRDTFPGLGRLSTTWLEPGFRWADRVVLQVPGTAYAPDVATVELGLYDATTGARLPVGQVSIPAGEGELLADNVRFGRIYVHARPGEASPPELGGTEGGNIPNPISVNFGDRMELVGYDLDRRAVHPGEAVTLALYWRGLRRMDVNYTISAQLVDAGQRKAAQHDSWPLDGAAPTAAWEPGQVLADKYILAVAQDTPAGVYNVRLAVYVFEEGTITHLPTIPEGGRMQANYIVLTTVRVAP